MPEDRKRKRLELFYTVDDIMELCGLSKNAAYVKIRELNTRLEENGYIVAKPGQVLKSWADQWLFMKSV